jgi:glucan phosphoethanolaminetransferase (alkaline phosphatase superfamily)
MRYIIFAICIFLGAFLGYKAQELIKVVATSVIGAFVVVRGLAFSLGGFPDTQILADIIKHKEYDLLEEYVSLYVLLYLVGFVGLIILGVWFQCKGEKKSKSDGKEYQRQK